MTTNQMTYDECLKSMYGLRRFGIKLGLDTIREILDGLGNPQHHYGCIHIAGTNGKGSVASTLSAVLQQTGFTVGLYTSPHLIRFNERIQINGQMVSNDDVRNSFLAVNQVHHGDREPTFFEYTTAMALHLFHQYQVDWAVIETGMGGRMDATNAIRPAVSIITNVSLEHQQYLGKTLSDIAWEKGGIIKNNTPVVTGISQPPAIDVIERIAKNQSAVLYRLGKDFFVTGQTDGLFSYSGLKHQWANLKSRLPGSHQIANAALVLAACEILQDQQVPITLDSLTRGFETTRWPGRLEVVSQSPMVILDGAHNLDAANCLASYLGKELSGRRITLVIGILDDKPFQEILDVLLPICDRVILTRPKIERALSIDRLVSACEGKIHTIETARSVDMAVKQAINTSASVDVVCVAGSLYVVGEAKAFLDNTPITEDHI
jgi:dihydrofolate synthase/folylpolyglutamate synthase